MKQTNIKVPVADLETIDIHINRKRFKNRSDFIRKAIKYLLDDLYEEAEATIGHLEDLGI